MTRCTPAVEDHPSVGDIGQACVGVRAEQVRGVTVEQEVGRSVPGHRDGPGLQSPEREAGESPPPTRRLAGPPPDCLTGGPAAVFVKRRERHRYYAQDARNANFGAIRRVPCMFPAQGGQAEAPGPGRLRAVTEGRHKSGENRGR
jgi:hypothetical protein